MSAGFKVHDEVFWGTNGAIEAYVQSLAAVAAGLFGPEDPLATFLHGELAGFFPGIVVVLDEHVGGRDACRRFLRALDESTRQLLAGDTFTDLGREWVGRVIAELRQKVVELAERPSP
jgi:hypothetical protein